jgi:hypothetical protein
LTRNPHAGMNVNSFLAFSDEPLSSMRKIGWYVWSWRAMLVLLVLINQLMSPSVWAVIVGNAGASSTFFRSCDWWKWRRCSSTWVIIKRYFCYVEYLRSVYVIDLLQLSCPSSLFDPKVCKTIKQKLELEI